MPKVTKPTKRERDLMFEVETLKEAITEIRAGRESAINRAADAELKVEELQGKVNTLTRDTEQMSKYWEDRHPKFYKAIAKRAKRRLKELRETGS